MKKISIFILLALAASCCISCKKKDVYAVPVSTTEYIGRQVDASNDSEEVIQLVNNTAIEAAFTLDYRPQTAEGGDDAEFLSAADLSGAAAESSGQGVTLGGGLRKLSDYKTVYFDPSKEKSRIEAIRAAQEADSAGQLQKAKDAGYLTVIDWGPRGNYSSAIQRPSICVMFSQPMTALAALGEQSSTSPLVSINPPIKGSFRWYGTSFLSFEGDEPCQSQQTYTITVAANAASLYGAQISGERVFTFYTETLKMKSVSPGEEFRKQTNFRFNDSSVPPKAAQQIGIEFNYPVREDDINQYLEISNGKAPLKFTLKQENEYKITASLTDTVDFETTITVTLKKGAKSWGGSRGTENDQKYSFSTPSAFKVSGYRRITAYGKYRNLIEINFSHSLNENTVSAAITTEPAMTIRAENIEIWGSTVRLYNLPIGYGARVMIMVASSVEDVYGRTLGAAWAGSVTLPNEPPPYGEARFLDYGHTMLEAQFPPRFLFEYTNITENSSYLLAANNNPWNKSLNNSTRINLTPGKINNKYFEEIDLSPYLNKQGRGFVSFRANLQLLTSEQLRDGTYRTGTQEIKNELNIQVTDLGMTVRYGFNKTTVLVTSLSTGKPVEGATVRLLSPSLVGDGADVSTVWNFGEAQTDKDGLAVLNTGAEILRLNTNSLKRQGFETPYVLAEKDGDRAIFDPSSHRNWRFGVNSGTPQRAEEIKPVAFMFSDRGLYKPGEVLTFRGVDRSLVLGMYTIYRGDYTVDFEEDRYKSTVISTVSGTTTESGGFYGSVNIPDDINPGSYRLVYRRNDDTSKKIIANVPVTVAFFERLKFQASLSAPAAAIISGDDINLKLQATYLSGGSLSGAKWESAWYDEMTVFQPKSPETKNYVFGPRRVWDSKRSIASESGVLGGQGTATLSQKTGGGKITGAAYLYQAEARVTDISNQMVSAYRSVMVHPAGFYIGLYRGGRGFARAGQELSYDYITVNTAGEKTADNRLFLQTGENAGQLTVELIREEWRRIQQRGVNGYIYDEYSQEQVVDSVQKIAIKNGGGSIKIKPGSAGYYTLRVSARDREGRTALTELNFYVTGSGGYWNMSNPSE
jgi:hypothetical protein